MENFQTGVRTCIHCNHLLKGRSDKKFCDDGCRNAYNNQAQSDLTYVRSINNILKNNRRILKWYLGEKESIKLSEEKLIAKGFQFEYHTHQYTRKSGDTYHYCYEFGYLSLRKSLCSLSKP